MDLNANHATGVETLTVAAVAVGFASVPAGSRVAVVDCETADVRYWPDGTAPTASVGHLLRAGERLTIDGDIGRYRFIRTGSQSATLSASFFAE